MTFSRAWTIIRWPLAILGLLAVVNYALPRLGDAAAGMVEFDASGSILAPDDGESPSEDPLDIPDAELAAPALEPNTGAVTDGVASPIADFLVNDTVADIDGDSLTLSDDPADSVVIAFDIPAGDPQCMSVMNLELTASEVLSPVEVGVFASTQDNPVEVVDNQAIEGDLEATTTPMATALFETEGTVTLNLTTGFQDYFTQDFAPGRPFVLTLVATSAVETQGGVSFVSANTESEEAPQLLWTGTPGCPVADVQPAATE